MKNLRPPKLTFRGTKEERTNPKVSKRKEIIKIGAEINEIKTTKTIEKISNTKSWFFEKKINKPLIRLLRNKSTQNQK